MSRSILAHLSFNFYRSCQADYRQALYRSSARLFMARISPASRPEFSYGKVSDAGFYMEVVAFHISWSSNMVYLYLYQSIPCRSLQSEVLQIIQVRLHHLYWKENIY